MCSDDLFRCAAAHDPPLDGGHFVERIGFGAAPRPAPPSRPRPPGTANAPGDTSWAVSIFAWGSVSEVSVSHDPDAAGTGGGGDEAAMVARVTATSAACMIFIPAP
jgi:hypothetical protein